MSVRGDIFGLAYDGRQLTWLESRRRGRPFFDSCFRLHFLTLATRAEVQFPASPRCLKWFLGTSLFAVAGTRALLGSFGVSNTQSDAVVFLAGLPAHDLEFDFFVFGGGVSGETPGLPTATGRGSVLAYTTGPQGVVYRVPGVTEKKIEVTDSPTALATDGSRLYVAVERGRGKSVRGSIEVYDLADKLVAEIPGVRNVWKLAVSGSTLAALTVAKRKPSLQVYDLGKRKHLRTISVSRAILEPFLGPYLSLAGSRLVYRTEHAISVLDISTGRASRLAAVGDGVHGPLIEGTLVVWSEGKRIRAIDLG